jgi:phosphohistidine phosphatase SixA
MVAVWLLVCTTTTRAGDGTHTIWMMRHALAPGYGDPPNMVLGQCHTQRTLSDEGRAHARAAGQWLRQNGLARARVVASP